MTKKLLATAAVLTGTLLAHQAAAGEQTGKVTQLLVRAADGLHYFTMDGPATGKPACATKSYWMIKDENSETGKHQYSMLLAAYAAGLTIRVNGANACTRWGDGEDVNLLRLIEPS